jgi:hypothetical protein
VKPVSVLFVDGETQVPDLSRNIQMVMNGANGGMSRSGSALFTTISARAQENRIIDLSDPAWHKEIEARLAGMTVLILDNFQCLTGNGPTALRDIQPWLIRLTAGGVAVIIVDHTNREGELQGSRLKRWIADLIIVLSFDSDEDRAAKTVTIRFPAIRRLHGRHAEPIRLQGDFTWDSFTFRSLHPEAPPEVSLRPEEEKRIGRMARVLVARERDVTYADMEHRVGIKNTTAFDLVRASEILTGAEKALLKTECDRLRQSPDPHP